MSESSDSSTHSMNVMKDKMAKMQRTIADMRSTVTNFMELDSLSFKGTRDPVIAKACIQILEKLFEILQCMDKQNVELAMYIMEERRISAIMKEAESSVTMDHIMEKLIHRNLQSKIGTSWLVDGNKQTKKGF